jgi:uncharacterized membrane protein YkoI
MMMTKYGLATALIGALILETCMPVFAASRDERREQTVLQGMSLSLCQAIATAERKTGGKAYDAGVDASHGKPRIVVETSGPKGVRTTIVDAQSGNIVGGHSGGEPD